MKVTIPFLELGQSGGIKMLFRLADFLVDKGCEVSIVAVRQKNEARLNFSTKAKVIRICMESKILNGIKWRLKKFVSYKFTSWLHFLSSLFNEFVKGKCLLDYLRKNKSDIIIANYFITAYITSLIPNVKYKLYYCQAFEPDFFIYYDDDIILGRSKISQRIENAVHRKLAINSYRLGLLMFANNKKAAKQISNVSGCFEVNNNIVNPAIGRDDEIIAKNTKRDIPVVGIIATNVFWKGTKYFMEAINVMQKDKQMPKFKVVCAFGPAPFGSPDIQAEWVTPKSQQELFEFYSSLDILISPMLITEEFPLPPLEAMSCRTAVISTPLDYGTDLKEYIMIQPGCPDSIISALKLLLCDEDLRSKIADNGYMLSKTYSWKHAEDQFSDMLQTYKIITHE